ncbi:MAG: hypothetical protein QMD97_02415 [Candidatus Aenigmarchaeota archaeon]|nr:hypothetical protein [Candidatus Aenigmarchaeota archaeon]
MKIVKFLPGAYDNPLIIFAKNLLLLPYSAAPELLFLTCMNG